MMQTLYNKYNVFYTPLNEINNDDYYDNFINICMKSCYDNNIISISYNELYHILYNKILTNDFDSKFFFDKIKFKISDLYNKFNLNQTYEFIICLNKHISSMNYIFTEDIHNLYTYFIRIIFDDKIIIKMMADELINNNLIILTKVFEIINKTNTVIDFMIYNQLFNLINIHINDYLNTKYNKTNDIIFIYLLIHDFNKIITNISDCNISRIFYSDICSYWYLILINEINLQNDINKIKSIIHILENIKDVINIDHIKIYDEKLITYINNYLIKIKQNDQLIEITNIAYIYINNNNSEEYINIFNKIFNTNHIENVIDQYFDKLLNSNNYSDEYINILVFNMYLSNENINLFLNKYIDIVQKYYLDLFNIDKNKCYKLYETNNKFINRCIDLNCRLDENNKNLINKLIIITNDIKLSFDITDELHNIKISFVDSDNHNIQYNQSYDTKNISYTLLSNKNDWNINIDTIDNIQLPDDIRHIINTFKTYINQKCNYRKINISYNSICMIEYMNVKLKLTLLQTIIFKLLDTNVLSFNSICNMLQIDKQYISSIKKICHSLLKAKLIKVSKTKKFLKINKEFFQHNNNQIYDITNI